MDTPAKAEQRSSWWLITVPIVLVVLAVCGVFVDSGVHPSLPPDRHRETRMQARCLALACADFCMDVGRPPSTLTELVDGTGINKWDGPYLEPARIPDDPWGRPYGYDAPDEPGGSPDVFSLGGDGAPGGSGEHRDFHTRKKQ